jgi:hypothetical protein
MTQKSKSRMGPKTQKAMDTQASSGRGKAVADGFKKFASEVKSIPGNIARDVKMGASAGVFSGREKQAANLARKDYSQADIEDYFARTDATIARNKAQQNFMRNDRSDRTPAVTPEAQVVAQPAQVVAQPAQFIAPAAIRYGQQDIMVPQSGAPMQPISLAQVPSGLTPPPAFQPIQFGQTFDPMPPPAFQPLQFAAEGGAINSSQRTEFPGGGLASFLTSNMDEIEDNVLAFGRPAGINSMGEIANRMAQMGRGGDNFVVHASEREMMVPREVVENNPDLRRQIMESIAAEGGDPQAYIVGNDANSINPMTGQREFFLKKLIRGVKKVFKKIAPIVLPIALNFLFPGMGSIAAGALGSGIGTLVQGGSIKDALKSAVIGGAVGGISSGVSGAISGDGFMAGVKQGFTGTPGMGFFEVNPSVKSFFGGAGAGAGVPAAPPAVDGSRMGVAMAESGNAPVGQTGTGGADPSFFDKTKNLFFPETRVTVGGETLINPSVTDVLRAGGITPLKATAAQQTAAASIIKDAAPGFLRTYGPLALAGTALAAAGGAFTPPEQPDLTKLGYQPPTQEEIDARRVFPGGVVPPTVNYGQQDIMVPGPSFQQASLAQGPFGLTSPPAFAPINFAPQFQPIRTAAEGGAITEFPRRSGFINGPGTEKSDSIPAMLSDGEFVMTARAVRGLGDGSREKGVRKMYDMMRMFEGGAVA